MLLNIHNKMFNISERLARKVLYCDFAGEARQKLKFCPPPPNPKNGSMPLPPPYVTPLNPKQIKVQFCIFQYAKPTASTKYLCATRNQEVPIH